MYLIIESYTRREYNEYYIANSYNESQYNNVEDQRVFYCHDDVGLATWVKANPKSRYKAYKAQPVTITTNTTVSVAIS